MANYYSMMKKADAILIKIVEWVRTHPDKQVPIINLTLEFQQKFGFGDKRLMKMLDVYVQHGQITIEGGNIRCPQS